MNGLTTHEDLRDVIHKIQGRHLVDIAPISSNKVDFYLRNIDTVEYTYRAIHRIEDRIFTHNVVHELMSKEEALKK